MPLKWKNLLRGNCGNLEPWNAFFFQMSLFSKLPFFFRYSYKPNILRWVLGKLISTSVHSDESWRLPSLDGTAHSSAEVWLQCDQKCKMFHICLSVNFQPLQHFIPFCHLQFSFFMFPSLCWQKKTMTNIFINLSFASFSALWYFWKALFFGLDESCRQWWYFSSDVFLVG